MQSADAAVVAELTGLTDTTLSTHSEELRTIDRAKRTRHGAPLQSCHGGAPPSEHRPRRQPLRPCRARLERPKLPPSGSPGLRQGREGRPPRQPPAPARCHSALRACTARAAHARTLPSARTPPPARAWEWCRSSPSGGLGRGAVLLLCLCREQGRQRKERLISDVD
jgi:hypothetical protein